MTSQNKRGAIFATLGAAALFATSATARAISGVEADSVTVATSRLLIGALGLVAWSFWRGRGVQLQQLWRTPTVWLMACGVAGYQALFFVGTGRVGVAIGTLASLALGPLMAGMLAWAIGGGAPSRTWWISTCIAIAGLVLLTVGRDAAGTADLLGIFAAVGAGAAYAIFTVFGVRLAKQDFLGTDLLAAAFMIGAVLLLPLGISHATQLFTANGVLLSLWLGLVATTLAYIGFGRGITELSAGTVATLNLAEPVVATVFGVIVVQETITIVSGIGAALIALALALLAASGAQ